MRPRRPPPHHRRLVVARLPRYANSHVGPVALLWLLTGLFAFRVVGQALVAFLHVGFLPAMPEWYSGLVPYPILLPVQVVMLAIMTKINVELTRGRGFFAMPRPRLGRGLRWFAVIYFLAMVARYVVTRALPIPIVFHWVLAAYIFVWGGLTITSGPGRRQR